MKNNLCRIFTAHLFVFLLAGLIHPSNSQAFKTTFTPNASVGQEYHEKKFNNDNNNLYDYISTLSAGFNLDLEKKTEKLSFGYTPSYSSYYSDSEKNTWRHNAYMKGSMAIAKKTILTMDGTFLRTEEEEFFKRDPLQRKNNEAFTLSTSSIRVDRSFGARNSMGLGYKGSISDNEGDADDDHEVHNPYFNYTYWLTPLVGLEFQTSYANTEFDTNSTENWQESIKISRKFTRHLNGFFRATHDYVDDETEEYNIYNPSLGIDYTFTRDMFLSLAVGYRYRDQEDTENSSDLSVDASLTKKWSGPKWTMDIALSTGYENNLDDDQSETENSGISQFYQASYSANYGFTQTIIGNFNSSYKLTDHEITDKDVELWAAGTGLSWQVLKYLSLRGNYEFNQENSTDDPNDFYQNIFTLALNYRPIKSLSIGMDYNFNTKNATSDSDDFDEHGFSVGLNYSPYDWFSISNRYQYINLNANTEDDSYDDTRITLNFTVYPVYRSSKSL